MRPRLSRAICPRKIKGLSTRPTLRRQRTCSPTSWRATPGNRSLPRTSSRPRIARSIPNCSALTRNGWVPQSWRSRAATSRCSRDPTKCSPQFAWPPPPSPRNADRRPLRAAGLGNIDRPRIEPEPRLSAHSLRQIDCDGQASKDRYRRRYAMAALGRSATVGNRPKADQRSHPKRSFNEHELPQRQREGEGRSAPYHAFDPDLASVKFDELPRDGETESGAFHFLRSCPHLLELFEHPILIRRGNANAGVRDRDLHDAIIRSRPDGDLATLRRELQRVREQIEQHLLHLALVGANRSETLVNRALKRDAAPDRPLPY